MGKQKKEEPLLPGDRYGVINEPDGENIPVSVDMSESPQAVAEAARYGRGIDEELHFQELRGA